MKLSKCSIEFEFNAEGGFDEDVFEDFCSGSHSRRN